MSEDWIYSVLQHAATGGRVGVSNVDLAAVRSVGAFGACERMRID